MVAAYENNKTNVIYNLKRVLLSLYTEENMNYIISRINEKFNSFPVLYYKEDFSIHIRLKKSFVNKIQHTPLFYYRYLSDVFTSLFMANMDYIKDTYRSMFGDYGIEYIDEFCTMNYYHLINILTIGDNTIIIKLI